MTFPSQKQDIKWISKWFLPPTRPLAASMWPTSHLLPHISKKSVLSKVCKKPESWNSSTYELWSEIQKFPRFFIEKENEGSIWMVLNTRIQWPRYHGFENFGVCAYFSGSEISGFLVWNAIIYSRFFYLWQDWWTRGDYRWWRRTVFTHAYQCFCKNIQFCSKFGWLFGATSKIPSETGTHENAILRIIENRSCIRFCLGTLSGNQREPICGFVRCVLNPGKLLPIQSESHSGFRKKLSFPALFFLRRLGKQKYRIQKEQISSRRKKISCVYPRMQRPLCFTFFLDDNLLQKQNRIHNLFFCKKMYPVGQVVSQHLYRISRRRAQFAPALFATT